MTGEAAALGSAVLWALATVVIKDVSGRLSAFYIMAVRTTIAALFAVVVIAGLKPSSIDLDIPSATMAVLLGSALVAILGDVAFVRAIAVEDVSRVFTVSTSLYILLSVGGSVIFAGEPFSWLLLLGGIAVLAGSRLVLEESKATQPLPGVPVDAPATRTRLPVFALWLSIVASIFWSGSLLAVSDALDTVDAFTATLLRLPFMALALVLVIAVRGDLRRHAWNARDLRILTLSGAFVLGSMLLFLLSAELTSAGTVAVLTSTSPIFAVPLAFFVLKERVTPRVLGGTTACMAGIWLTLI